jgi:hypothetical protein
MTKMSWLWRIRGNRPINVTQEAKNIYFVSRQFVHQLTINFKAYDTLYVVICRGDLQGHLHSSLSDWV